MAPIVLGYWDIRGFAQPIRLMLAAVGADFKEEFHSMGPEFSKEAWFKVKPTLPLDFPNLPYLYDGDVKISQSISIMRYIARKFGLWPENEKQAIRADLVEQQLADWRTANVHLFYDTKNFDTLKEDYKTKELPAKIQSLSKFLGDNEWLVGDKMTYVDFFAYEWLDVQKTFWPQVLDSTPNLKKLVEKIEAIPKVKEFMKSKDFMKWPINNNQAAWGSRLHPAP